VDRVSKSEGLDALPADYSKLPPPLPASVPELGPPLPGDLGPAIVKSQQPVTAAYAAPGQDPNDALRKEAEAAAASSVFFRSGSPNVIMPRIQRTWEMECDACYRAVFGDGLDQLLAAPSIQAEERGSLAEPSRFGTLA